MVFRMSRELRHPFASRWNHNTHHFPLMAARIPVSARRVLDIGCGEGTFCRFIAKSDRLVVGADMDVSVLPASCHEVQFAATLADALAFADDAFHAVDHVHGVAPRGRRPRYD